MADTQKFSVFDDYMSAVNLQLQEIHFQRNLQKGKKPEYAPPPDNTLAFLDFAAELERSALILADEKFARSIAMAVEADGIALEDIKEEEFRIRQDRAFALRISDEDPELESPDPEEIRRLDAMEEDNEVAWACRKIASLSVGDETQFDASGPSISYALRQKEALEQLPLYKVTCAACTDMFRPHETIRLPCKHIFCTACLKSLFVRASTDESLFPPRCCRQQISILVVQAELSTDELLAFHNAELEFSTTNRIYCAQISCGRFIPPSQVYQDLATCAQCSTETCVHCKSLRHDGECSADEALQAVIMLARDEGWQRCFGCNAIVQLETGCNHMTCKCSTEFCYQCGVRWKECSCDAWEERNIGLRAEEVVDREAIHPLPVVERQRRVREMRQELRENHECDHHGRWERRDGYRRRGYNCEMCGAHHWKYILACRHCHLTACEDCRRHRV